MTAATTSPGRCADCSGPLASGVDHVGARRARRCGTCSRRRSTTNILTLSLLLAALLSYLWYHRLTDSTAATIEEQIAPSLADLSQARVSPTPPPPAAAIAAPAVQPARA